MLLLASGFFSFINVMWVIVGVLLTISSLWVFGAYVLPQLAKLPDAVLEMLGWLISIALIYFPAQYIEGGGAVALAMVGCVGIAFASAVTYFGTFGNRCLDELWPMRVYLILLGGIWTIAAIVNSSSVIGTFPVVAYLVLTSSFVLPVLDNGFMFGDRKIAPTMLLSSGSALVIFLGLHAAGVAGNFALFAPGVFWLCGLSYATGCMLFASRHYSSDVNFGYLVAQVVAIASGLAALFIGHVWEIPVLQEIGGTFAALYIVEKFFDLPWNKDHWALVSMAFAGLLYLGVRFAEMHPQYFLGF